MYMRLVIVVATAFIATSVFAEAYRWVDEDGIVHYTDKPHPGAERIVLPSDSHVAARQRFAPPPAPPEQAQQQAAQAQKFRYTKLDVVSPGPEETLWNIEGELNVTLNLTPALQEGHRIRVYFDGTPQMVDGTSFQLQEVWRGVHNLQAEVLDATGKLMIRSAPNRFYVQQTSIVHPK